MAYGDIDINQWPATIGDVDFGYLHVSAGTATQNMALTNSTADTGGVNEALPDAILTLAGGLSASKVRRSRRPSGHGGYHRPRLDAVSPP